MQNIKHTISTTCLLGTLLLSASSLARAETQDCTPILSAPTTITAQGVYCLVGDISTNIASGNAIEVATNNVIIDLNGWKLGGLAAGANTEAVGINAVDRFNITIRNGTVRGFYTGIGLTGQGHIVEDIRAEQNRGVGIQVGAHGGLIRRNQVVDTGGSTRDSVSSIGISAAFNGVRVIDNEVSGLTENDGDGVYGIMVFLANDAVVQNNRVTGVAGASLKTTAGIIIGFGNGIMDGNVISTAPALGILDYGIQFGFAGSGGYRNNIVSGADASYNGGTDLGGNVDL